ncbi:MAG TPA: APC family permease, partial [Terriglobales bacterium]
RLATEYGIAFSIFLYVVFTISERLNQQSVAGGTHDLEQFRVQAQEDISADAMEVRPGNVLVAVRDPRNLYYLRDVLTHTDTTKQDVVVMTSRIYHREFSFSGSERMDSADVFEEYERTLFTAVVNEAEKQGRHVSLLVAPTNDVFESIVATGARLNSTVIVCGLSNKLTAEEQGKLTGDAWERLPDPKPRMRLIVAAPNEKWEFELGPHSPRLRAQDLKLMHDIWLQVTRDPAYSKLHHYHVVAVALRELQQRLNNSDRSQALTDIREEIDKSGDV